MKIAFCGDLVLRTPEDHIIGSQLQKALNGCDIKVINFEVPVMVQNCYGIHKSGPVHNQSQNSPEWIMHKGFNVITLANNHSLDYGEKGLTATINAFKGIKILGIGSYDNAYDICVIEHNSEKVGLLGLTHKEFGCVDIDSGKNWGTAMLTSPKAFTSIANAKSIVDKLYIVAHAGIEYMDGPLPEWRELYRSFIDIGADGVIASHPHVPQGLEIYKGKPIFYSLGNFLFEVPDPEIRLKKHKKWYDSLMVIVDTSDNFVKTLPLTYDYNKKIVDINSSRESKEYIDYLNSLLISNETYQDFLNKEVDNLRKQYRNMMMAGGAYRLKLGTRIKNLIKPIFGKRRTTPDEIHLLNLFQCESHRWMMMRLLRGKANE